MKTFTVFAERDASIKGWAVWCDEPGCVSQVRQLSEAAEELRDAIAYLSGLDETDFVIDVVPRLSEDDRILIEQWHKARNDQEEATRRAQEASSKLVHSLLPRGFTQRDVATLLGVSHQRVSQLARS